MDGLAAARIGETFNQYAEGPRAALLRARLVSYLTERACSPVALVGEAPGYRGARVSGIPFTSERQLSGIGPGEATATVVYRVLRELGIGDDVLLWNVVPTHPGTATSNRPPSRLEVEAGMRFLSPLADGRMVIAVGRVAERAVGGDAHVRHPGHGGGEAFRTELHRVLGRARG